MKYLFLNYFFSRNNKLYVDNDVFNNFNEQDFLGNSVSFYCYDTDEEGNQLDKIRIDELFFKLYIKEDDNISYIKDDYAKSNHALVYINNKFIYDRIENLIKTYQFEDCLPLSNFFIDKKQNSDGECYKWSLFDDINIDDLRVDESKCNIHLDPFTTNYNKFILALYSINEHDNDILLNLKREYFNNNIDSSYQCQCNTVVLNTSSGVISLNYYNNDYEKELNEAINRADNIESKIYPIDVEEYTGYDEGIYIKIKKIFNDIDVYYKNINDDEYKRVDNELIQEYADTYICNIIGINPGVYDVKIVNRNDIDDFRYIDNIEVYAQDRSGYAHFKYNNGVGAYKDNGELKENAVIIYVSNSNKNTVTYNGAKGLIPVINKVISENKPLCIRVLDIIDTPQWYKIKDYGNAKSNERKNLIKEEAFDNVSEYWTKLDDSHYEMLESNIIKSGLNKLESYYKKIKGITNKILFNTETNEADTYFNMIEIKNGNNITIEGIGYNAGFYNCGLDFECCNSVEVKNLSFDCSPEDSISIRGTDNNDRDYGNFWIHNCLFNQGKNNWDITFENDKVYGDGSTDFKYAHNLTISYCTYFLTNKTCLFGENNESIQPNITLHHNYYNACFNRLPRARNTNIHMYNCYLNECIYPFDNGKNSILFAEYNKIYDCIRIMHRREGTAKLINNFIDNSGQEFIGRNIIFSDTTAELDEFETNKDLFYYDDENKKSMVNDLITDEHLIKRFIPFAAGNGKYDRKLDDIWFKEDYKVLLINNKNEYYLTSDELKLAIKKLNENKTYNDKYYKIIKTYINNKFDTKDIDQYYIIGDLYYGYVNDEIIEMIMNEDDINE